VRTRWGISPHVLAVTDEVLDFCRTVLDEVCDIFPDEVICVGGDECPTDEWVADPASLSRAASLGLAPERLQGWFMGELAAHLASRGRRMLAWDEILDGPVPPGTIVAAWRDVAQVDRALRAGHDVVACPCTELYLDYRQSSSPDEPIPVGRELPLDRVYAYDPGPVYGVQANLWTEHVDSARSVDYQLFPRLCAVAELAWSPLSARDWADFDRRLSTHADRLSALSVESRPPDGPRPWQRRPDAPGRPS
jgi:hexosaminidase